MLRLCRAAVVAVVVAGAATVAVTPAQARIVRCAAPARSGVVSLVGDGVGCREARRVAAAHSRSYKSRRACRSYTTACRVPPFTCSQIQLRPTPVRVLCTTRRGPQVRFSYRR
ncbi:hypothetical protein [Conexibacter sp. CPCC 206217]|uniref:hypothetical protein n=1 Tax=Conexibacter sp. CPCC 206217 TaxID=3064574 RepID=UPI00271E080D|nr:hypothetical protein [Conexibacter sp. CPCC 206217]MDO8210491.1 hypothetical protein [Conexibacter sp. CPCC 206217]